MIIQTIGKLKEVTLEYVGDGFPICNLEVHTGENRPIGFSAKGWNAERVFALLGEAPEGVTVEVYGDTEYRASKKPGDDRVFLDVVANEVLLLGNVGDPGSSFKVQGICGGVKAIDKRQGGQFYLGLVQELTFNKEGFLPGAYVEVALDDKDVAEWRAAEGQFVFVRGTNSGYKADNGRIWPRWSLDQANFLPLPAWLEEYAPEPEEPDESDEVDETDDAEEEEELVGMSL